MKNVNKDIRSLKAKMCNYRHDIKVATIKLNDCQNEIKDITKDELTVRAF